MRNCLLQPAYRSEDLGLPLPDSSHAASVAMPLWEHVCGYEEGAANVVEKLSCGYPRFFIHPFVNELALAGEAEFCQPGELCLPFPSERVASRALDYLGLKQISARTVYSRSLGIWFVAVAEDSFGFLKEYWQHSGEIVSSRRAQSALSGKAEPSDALIAKAINRDRLGMLAGVAPENVFLYPTGMAAITAAYRVTQQIRPGPAVQFGFPYIDTWELMKKWGQGACLFEQGDRKDLQKLAGQIESASAVFCEVPGNPLLRTPDLEQLSALCQAAHVPLVVDNTIATFANVDLSSFADIVVTSLTKFYSGVGDVMGGALIMNPQLKHAKSIQQQLAGDYEDLLWGDDALVLEQNSRDFAERIRQINYSAERVVNYLKSHPAVDKVYYPKYETSTNYARLKLREGGYGGLFSLLLADARHTTAAFYNALRVNKGPSLGTDFTLACPYTLLAHYRALDWVESCGVSRYLIRVSVGLEDATDLIARFAAALPEQLYRDSSSGRLD